MKEIRIEQKTSSDFSVCLVQPKNNNKKIFSLGHGKKRVQVFKLFIFLTLPTVKKNSSRSEVVDSLRVRYFLLTEFDCKKKQLHFAVYIT